MMELVFLAKAVSIENRTKELQFPSGFCLASIVPFDRGSLYIFPEHYLEHTTENSSVQAEQSFELFTGRKSRFVSSVNVPENWQDVGSVTHIEYESDKINGGGTGKPEIFRHKFGPFTRLHSSGFWMKITGPDLTVTEFGIEN